MTEDEVQHDINLSESIRVLHKIDIALLSFITLYLPLIGYTLWILTFKLPDVQYVSFYYGCAGIKMCFVITIYTLSTARSHSLYCLFIFVFGLVWMMIASVMTIISLGEPKALDIIFVHPPCFLFQPARFIVGLAFITGCFYGFLHFKRGPSVINSVLTLILFMAYLIRYDPSGTYKPIWVDWLG